MKYILKYHRDILSENSSWRCVNSFKNIFTFSICIFYLLFCASPPHPHISYFFWFSVIFNYSTTYTELLVLYSIDFLKIKTQFFIIKSFKTLQKFQ